MKETCETKAIGFTELLDRIDAEKEASEVLLEESDSADLEIIERCYTNCTECYTAGRANPRAGEVSLPVIEARLDWLKRFTNAKRIYILGGEPLLHTQFREICQLIAAKGFSLFVVTSGVVSNLTHEVRNRDYLLEAYKAGCAQIQVSYHPKRNENAFDFMYSRCKEAAPARLANLKMQQELLQARVTEIKAGPVTLENARQLAEVKSLLDQVSGLIISQSLTSTVALSNEIIKTEADFIAAFRFLVQVDGGDFDKYVITSDTKGERPILDVLKGEYQKFLLSFSDFAHSAYYGSQYTREWGEGQRFIYRVIGTTSVRSADNGGHLITRPRGTKDIPSVCPAMSTKLDVPGKIKLESLLVRSDGEVTFADPGCIEVAQGLANTDTDLDPKAIYDQARRRVVMTDRLIHLIDRRHLSGREDNGDCHSCPFDSACRTCHSLRRPGRD